MDYNRRVDKNKKRQKKQTGEHEQNQELCTETKIKNKKATKSSAIEIKWELGSSLRPQRCLLGRRFALDAWRVLE